MTRPVSRRGEAPLGDAEFAAAFAPLEGSSHLLAAVSGGPDSTALLGSLVLWSRARGGPEISAATVDHGLRPAARAEAELVAGFAAQLGVRHAILNWSGQRRTPVSQEAARQARYRLLAAHAGEIGATHLVTAHTLDDQAETLMMRLAAGSGLSGLAGMRREVARGPLRLVRPLLGLRKARLVATCQAHGWDFVEDPSNADERFARVRWRREILPLLSHEGLDSDRLGRLAERLLRADEALDDVAKAVFRRVARASGSDTVVDLADLRAEPTEIGLRVLRIALGAQAAESAGAADGEAHLRLERLEACYHALLDAAGKGEAAHRTLTGRLLRLDSRGALTISPEGPRRRGRREAVTPIEIPDTPSLGREPGRA